MNIIITDGFTLNPGDLSWKAFETFGNLQYHNRTLPIETIERCMEANIIITNKTIINADTIHTADRLELILVTATGYNNVDIAAAKKRGITVCNVPTYGTYSVAQHTFALLLQLSNHVGINAASVAAGQWQKATDWCYSLQPVIELKDKTLGIIGLGKIGRQVALIAQAFGMKVIYNRGKEIVANTVEVSQHQLFMQSDFISLHCPLTSDNKAFVNKELLGLAKPTAFLINTSRGGLINEKDLSQLLQQNKIAGAALDVLTNEPPEKNNPLTALPNCIITPHNAWISAEARGRIMDTTFQNLQAFLTKRPQNIVNT
jgi:glycerate dehydrogenase